MTPLFKKTGNIRPVHLISAVCEELSNCFDKLNLFKPKQWNFIKGKYSAFLAEQ